MLQKSLYLTRNILFIYLFFARCEVFFKDMLESVGGERGFLNSDNVALRGVGGLKIDVFVRRLLWMAPKK